MKTLHKKIIILLTFISTANIIAANWVLDNHKSYLNFTSVKNSNIIEVHKFDKLSGKINEDGIADVKINLKSVDTGIEIRDERLKDYLFDTKKYPDAIFSTHIDMKKILEELYKNSIYKTTLEGYLNLKGHRIELKIPVDIKYLDNKNVQVMSASPVTLNIDDFKMGAGLEKLKELANLRSIGFNVPVNFKVVFNKK